MQSMHMGGHTIAYDKNPKQPMEGKGVEGGEPT
jgi:hypothetical protein